MRLLPTLLAAAAVSATTAVGAVPAEAAIPQACPATFTVQHDDRIGALAIPAGPYALSVLDASQPSPAWAATRRFAAFLQDSTRSLPAPWMLDAAERDLRRRPRRRLP